MIKSLKKSDYIVANSNFTKNLAIKLGVNHKNINVIHPGCNYPIEINKEAKEFANLLFGKSFPKLITISRLDVEKVIKYLND